MFRISKNAMDSHCVAKKSQEDGDLQVSNPLSFPLMKGQHLFID